jgi:vancomycin permeability regulator SanA
MLFVWSKILGLENLIYLRSAINSIFIAVGLLVLTLIFINTKNPSYQNQSSGSNKVKIAVVLGAAVWSDNRPSPSLASRADKAAELYTKGAINKIQLTGGNAPGELSEAEVSFKYILKKGVDRNDIWIEKETTSTIEQIRFVKNELIGEKGLNSVMIISDIYHIRRVKEICRFYDIKADVAAANLNLKTDKIIFYQLRECLALLFFWLFAL